MSYSSSWSPECVLSMLAVGFLWGATNPLLRLGSKSSADATRTANDAPVKFGRRILAPFIDLTNLFLNWRFSLPFIVNQTASILFVMLVSRFPVSIVVPCVNALQFVFTAVIGHLIGERTISRRSYVGTIMVLVGVLIMMISDTLQSDLQLNDSVRTSKE
uniref:Transmembrane protein 234 homolog n=1 Tax=Haemonchus contortus TaxID=6289 RepID=A0A7I5E5D4_HAECO